MGNPVCKRVRYDRFSRFPCSREGVVQREGGWYCKLHDPERPDRVRRREEANRRFDERVQRAQDASEAPALRAEVERLRKALEDAAASFQLMSYAGGRTSELDTFSQARGYAAECERAVRAALEEKP